MKLMVKAAGTAMVPDYEAMASGVLRFVGRRWDASVGVAGGWAPVEHPVEVPFRAEYLQEIKAGTLEPADQETARICGVPFSVA